MSVPDNSCEKQEETSFGVRSLFKICFDWMESIVQAIIIVVFVMNYFFRAVNVSGGSMMNTLHDNDKLVISKWQYTPKNGDIVIIKCKDRNDDCRIIKRIIALGGQKLKIDYDNSKIFIDNKALNEPYIKERMYKMGDYELPDIIPEGYCFVMGDNRNNSVDSRFSEIGLIPYKDIVGKAEYIISPFDRIGKIY